MGVSLECKRRGGSKVRQVCMELGGGVWIGWSTPGCSGRIQVSVSINPGLWTGEKGSRRQVPTCTGAQGREVLFGYEQQPFSEVSFNLVCVCSCTGCAPHNAEVRGLQVFGKLLSCLGLSLLCSPSWPRRLMGYWIFSIYLFTPG